MPVYEHNGDLGNPAPFFVEFVCHFDLERVAVGLDPVQVKKCQGASAEGLEALR